ncbi:MAG TPA: ABC transporter permease [Terriglobales bacterium]|nr:ABC transporter permease [Terriglobales bacterium]
MRLRRRMLNDLDADIREHIEHEIQDNIARGMPPAEARYAALRSFGNVTRVKEETRAIWTLVWLEQLLQDLRFGLRMLRKSPSFTTIAVLTLALGIGANTAVFSVIDGVLLRPLPYPNSQQLVAMKQNESLLNVIDIQRQMRSFSAGGGINVMAMDYTDGPEPVRVNAGLVDAGFLQTLGIRPLLGRLISPEDDVKGGPRQVVVTYSFWKNSLHGDPQPLGRRVTLGGNAYTLIGVMPANFELPRERADLFVSLWVGYPEAAAHRGVHFLHTYWRLKPGVTLAQARLEMSAMDRQLAQQYPGDEGDRRKLFLPLHQFLVGDVRTPLLFGAVGLVLLIAGANFLGLLTARAVARRQELVIRTTLGAGRSRLFRQAITESTLLALLGGSAGLVLAKWSTGLLLSLKPAALEHLNSVELDWRLLLFVLGISLAASVLFGVAPAWSASRAQAANALKDGGRSATDGAGAFHLRRVLVGAQFALALVLLIGAGLLIKGFSRLNSVDPGFNPENLLTLNMELPATRYAEIPRQTAFRRELLAKVGSLPGIEAAMVTDVPLGGNYVSHGLVIDGRPPVPAGSEPEVQSLSTMGNYFRVMQIPIREGRDFTDMDREGHPLVAIVNEEFVKELFPHQDPIGGRIDWIRPQGQHDWMTIVGVVGNVKHSGLNQPVDPAVYAPFAQSDEAWRRWMALVIRTRAPSATVIEEVKKQVWSLDGQIAVGDIASMDDLMADSLAQQRFNMVLLGIFALLALILACVGIYGLTAYAVGRRTHEIGIRMALGAQRKTVLCLVLGDGAKLVLAGIIIGLLGGLALTRLMRSMLFDVKPADPATYAAVAGLLAVVAVVACYIPARRAASVEPMTALRHE